MCYIAPKPTKLEKKRNENYNANLEVVTLVNKMLTYYKKIKSYGYNWTDHKNIVVNISHIPVLGSKLWGFAYN